MITLLLHIANQEPVKVDVEELPTLSDNAVIGRNPRERNDKEFPWVEDGVTTVIFPWWRINFIQVLPSVEITLNFPLPYRD
ncbi:hypothetical protein MASR2M15_02190 [Anaerolineales bacterium]